MSERLNPGLLLIDIIESAAARFPDRLALQMREEGGLRQYTYAEMMARVRRLSRSLGGMGMGKGDRVILWARLTPQWVLAYLGALYHGCVVVPLDADYAPEQARDVLGQTRAVAVFSTSDALSRLREIDGFGASPRLVCLDREQDHEGLTALESLFQCPPAETAQAVSPDDMATIFYTSGTTGAPKGVVLAHRSLAASVQGLLEYVEGSETDRVLALIPSHHILGAVANVLIPLAKGGSITYLRALNSVELLRTLNDTGITILPAVPQLFYLLHERIFDEVRRKRVLRLLFRPMLRACGAVRQATGLNPGRTLFARVHRAFGGRLRLLISAGSSFDPAVIRDFFALGFTVQQGYALTESGAGGTFTPHFDNRLGSVGRAMPGVEMKLVGADESGVGEIAIAGPTIMQGYYRDEAATAEVLRDGWLHTGDLARVDDGGHYYVTGRRKDMIVLSSGKKVQPDEIELCYARSPVIKELCVLGLADASDYARSERLHAVVVPDFDYLRANRIVNCKDAIREDVEEISATLPAHKRVLSFEIRPDPLPRTTTRKLMRHVVAAEAAKDGGGRRPATSRYRFVEGDDRLLALPSSKRVVDLVRDECRVEGDLHLDMNLELDLGVDSLHRIELMARVERALQVAVDEDAALRILSLRDLLRAVAEKRGAGVPAAAEAGPEQQVTWKQILSGAGDEAARRYLLRSSGLTVLVHYALLRIAYAIAKVCFRLEVRGRENLPERPFILCPNHQSYLDGVLMAAVLPYGVFTHLLTLGLTEFFSGGIKSRIAGIGRVVPIDPDTNVVQATQFSAAGLRAGQNLLIFPEGSMTSDGRLQPFKKGAAILARELQVPIVPVAISGSFQAWSKVRPGIHPARITITFGRPLRATAAAGQEDGDRERDYAETTQRLKAAVAELMGSGEH